MNGERPSIRAVLAIGVVLRLWSSAIALGQGSTALPPGHPPVEGNPRGGHAELQDMPVPESFARPQAGLPAGVALVRVVDGDGHAVTGARVHLGTLREGEADATFDADTGSEGVAQFEHLSVDPDVAYRASTAVDGARTLSDPFQLSPRAGERIQLVRFDVIHEPRAVLISDATVQIGFHENRMIVVERFRIVNFSNSFMGRATAHPTTFAPVGGLRFGLPPGFLSFSSNAESMGDQQVVEEHGAAVLHGSIPPTGAHDRIDVTFEYRLLLGGSDSEMTLAFPLPAAEATVVTQASSGMRLDVADMPPAEEQIHSGQRHLITGRQMTSPSDLPITELRIRLHGIPPVAGPERTAAVALAALIALAAFAAVVEHRRRARTVESSDPSLARQVLEEAHALGRAHASGDVGPETFRRRKSELATLLALVLRGQAGASP